MADFALEHAFDVAKPVSQTFGLLRVGQLWTGFERDGHAPQAGVNTLGQPDKTVRDEAANAFARFVDGVGMPVLDGDFWHHITPIASHGVACRAPMSRAVHWPDGTRR